MAQKESYFTTIILQYAYTHVNIHTETAQNCYLIILSGDTTAPCRFKTRYYGLTNMPADFQKAIDTILIDFTNTQSFLYYKLIATSDTLDGQLDLDRKCLETKILHQPI